MAPADEPEDRAVFQRLKSTGRITHPLRRLMTQQWNVCSACDHLTVPWRPLFAGYDEAGHAIYVGACCASRLVELATPSYPRTRLNVSVPDDQPLWRYMDFPKFVAMLRVSGLYFPRADKLEDRFEGAVGLARRQADWDSYYLDFFRRAVRTPPPGYEPPPLTEDQVEAEARRLLESYRSTEITSRSALVSCWHASGIESEAIWRLYSPPPTMGVAIQTTVSQLWDATANDDSAVVGRVQYIDFRKAFARNDRDRIFCKRASLSHEREVRAVLQNDPRAPVDGKVIECDLNALIEAVVISPFAADWFAEVVSDVIARFGYDMRVRPSELLEEPFF